MTDWLARRRAGQQSGNRRKLPSSTAQHSTAQHRLQRRLEALTHAFTFTVRYPQLLLHSARRCPPPSPTGVCPDRRGCPRSMRHQRLHAPLFQCLPFFLGVLAM
jgi:hypothetical protein